MATMDELKKEQVELTEKVFQIIFNISNRILSDEKSVKLHIEFFKLHQSFQDRSLGLVSEYAATIEADNFRGALDVHERIRQHIVSNYAPFLINAFKIVYSHENASNEFDKEFRAIDVILSNIKVNLLKFLLQSDNLQDVKKNIPSEQPAPIRVKVDAGRLVLETAANVSGAMNIESIDRIRESISDNLKGIIEDLEDSNADRRFIRSLKNLDRELSKSLARNSVESIGVNARIVGDILEIVKEEINSITMVQINHTISTISVLVCQFNEWNLFVSESERLDTKSINGLELARLAEGLAAELETRSDVIEIDIVHRIRDMTNPIIGGIIRSEAIIPALLPSLSNLFASISNFIFEVGKTISYGSVDSQIIGGGVLLAVAFQKIVTKFFPLFIQFRPLSFISSVIDYTVKYFSPIISLMA